MFRAFDAMRMHLCWVRMIQMVFKYSLAVYKNFLCFLVEGFLFYPVKFPSHTPSPSPSPQLDSARGTWGQESQRHRVPELGGPHVSLSLLCYTSCTRTKATPLAMEQNWLLVLCTFYSLSKSLIQKAPCVLGDDFKDKCVFFLSKFLTSYWLELTLEMMRALSSRGGRARSGLFRWRGKWGSWFAGQDSFTSLTSSL